MESVTTYKFFFRYDRNYNLNLDTHIFEDPGY